MAAATLLQGSDGTVQEVAGNAVTVARIFEVYLSGKQPDNEVNDDLYATWVLVDAADMGMGDN